MYISEEDESPVQKMKCKACASGAGDSLHFMGECGCRRRLELPGRYHEQTSCLLSVATGKEEREENGSAASGREGFRAALRLKQNIAQMRSTAGDLTDIIPG